MILTKSGGVENPKGVLEWDGDSWNSLTNDLCAARAYHTTFVYGGGIYHMGMFPYADELVNR